MNGILNIFKKRTKKDNSEWYTAKKELENGYQFEVGVKATSEEEACEFIQRSSNGRILSIRKDS